jgi:PleD family two-component response regulator
LAFAFFTWSIGYRLSVERVQAYTDFLTGLANRRMFSIQLEMEYDRARRYGHAPSLSACGWRNRVELQLEAAASS